MSELYIHSPICLNGVVLSLSTGTTSPFGTYVEYTQGFYNNCHNKYFNIDYAWQLLILIILSRAAYKWWSSILGG
jgi:hypothetical protein